MRDDKYENNDCIELLIVLVTLRFKDIKEYGVEMCILSSIAIIYQ